MKKLLIWRSRKTKTTKISKSTWLIAKVSRKDPSVRTFCNFKLLITTSPHMPIWIRLITSLLNYSIKILWISAKSLLTRTINQGLISLGGSIRVIDRALCMGFKVVAPIWGQNWEIHFTIICPSMMTEMWMCRGKALHSRRFLKW